MLRRWLHYIVPILMIALALAVRQAVPQVEEVRLKVFDVFQRLSPRPYTPVPVRFIDLDDESLSRIGQWPWPRTIVAQMVANLANAGAAVVVFDVVFADPDRTSPTQVLPLWPATPEVQNLIDSIDTLPDHDAVLADILAGQCRGRVRPDRRCDGRAATAKGLLRHCRRQSASVYQRLYGRRDQPPGD